MTTPTHKLLPLLLLSLLLHTPSLANKNSQLVLSAQYLTQLHNKIQHLWKPKKITIMDLHHRSATVTLWLKPNGAILKVKLTNTSGHKHFDASLLKSIKLASPFTPPPTHLTAQAQKNGLEIVFRRRVFQKKLLPLQRSYKGSATIPNWQPKKINSKTKTKNK